jgi:hypothetical protein
MQQFRRCFVANGGKPLRSTDFLRWAFPRLTSFKAWHRWSCRRALLVYAIPIGRSRGRGTAVIWAPRDMARHGRKTSLVRNELSRD